MQNGQTPAAGTTLPATPGHGSLLKRTAPALFAAAQQSFALQVSGHLRILFLTSSPEFVGELRLGQFAKLMEYSDLHDFEASKTESFSDGEFEFVV